MKNIILFDQDCQHYRIPIYHYFNNELSKMGYNLIVIYDKKLNNISKDNLFLGAIYSFNNLNALVNKFNCTLIIQYIWLKYKFLIPFMFYNRLKGVKTIVWSHGVNLQLPNQQLKNQIYYLRQKLANALIIFSENQKKFIHASHEKLFVANNTLDFKSFPEIKLSKEQIKQKYGYSGKKIILSVARFEANNRKVEHLVSLSEKLDDNFKILIVGPGVSKKLLDRIKDNNKVKSFEAIYDNEKINEFYKMADLFCMPGAIGLALNQAFYYSTPVIVEDVNQGPEIFYLHVGENGFLYKENDIEDLKRKVINVFKDHVYYEKMCNSARQTIISEGSLEKMYQGFADAIKYVENKHV